MSDEQIQTEAQVSDHEDSAGDDNSLDGESKSFKPEYIDKLRRENSWLRKQAKVNADKATRLDELEASQKTELQKLTEDRDTYKRRGDEYELAAARYEIALDKGLSRSQAKRLVGSNRDELAADADELLTDLNVAKQKQPKPNPAQGAGEAVSGSGDWLRDKFKRAT